jgi:hypothetical protein
MQVEREMIRVFNDLKVKRYHRPLENISHAH